MARLKTQAHQQQWNAQKELPRNLEAYRSDAVQGNNFF